jgi:hypothetical protein
MKEMKGDSKNPNGVGHRSARVSCGIGVLALALNLNCGLMEPGWCNSMDLLDHVE